MAPFAQKRVLAHDKPPGPPHNPTGFGRPSEFRPEYCELVMEAMASGISLEGFAGQIRVARETIYRWMTVHRDFSDAVSRARAARTLWWELKLMRSRKGAETTASIFALRNCAPDEWKDLKHTETLHVHAIAQLSDAELNRIAAANQPVELIDVTPGQPDPQQDNGR